MAELGCPVRGHSAGGRIPCGAAARCCAGMRKRGGKGRARARCARGWRWRAERARRGRAGCSRRRRQQVRPAPAAARAAFWGLSRSPALLQSFRARLRWPRVAGETGAARAGGLGDESRASRGTTRPLRVPLCAPLRAPLRVLEQRAGRRPRLARRAEPAAGQVESGPPAWATPKFTGRQGARSVHPPLWAAAGGNARARRGRPTRRGPGTRPAGGAVHAGQPVDWERESRV